MSAWGYVIGAGITVGGLVLGKVLEGKSEDEQRRLLSQAVDEYGNIDMPRLEKIAVEELGPSEYAKIKNDPSLRKTQTDSLAELRRIYEGGGKTLGDEANMQADLSRSAQLERSSREGIRDEMNARGTMGGGSELMMRLKASSDGANRNAQSGLQTAARREARASDSILSAGKLGGDIRGQDFSEAAAKASAQDSVNRYNTDARQKAAYYNAGLPQQQFDNQMRVAAGKANAYNGQATQEAASAQRNREFIGGVVDSAAGAATEYERERAADKRWRGY